MKNQIVGLLFLFYGFAATAQVCNTTETRFSNKVKIGDCVAPTNALHVKSANPIRIEGLIAPSVGDPATVIVGLTANGTAKMLQLSAVGGTDTRLSNPHLSGVNSIAFDLYNVTTSTVLTPNFASVLLPNVVKTIAYDANTKILSGTYADGTAYSFLLVPTISAGAGIAVTGAGTSATPFVITNTGDLSNANELQTVTKPTANSAALSLGGGAIPLVETNTATLTGSNLTTNVNGVVSNSVDLATIIPATTNTLTSSGNIVTSTVNGVSSAANVVNTNDITLSGTTLETSVNGVISNAVDLSTIIPATNNSIINNNDNTITSTVNGVDAQCDAVTSVSTSVSGSDLTTSVNGVSSTVTLPNSITSWDINGNAGTTSANFLGTTDARDLEFKVNGNSVALFGQLGNVRLGSNSNFANGASSLAQGEGCTADGDFSFAQGDGCTASAFCEVALGQLNTIDTNASSNTFILTNRLLTIGNTLGALKSDAFTILKNAKCGINISNFETTTSSAILQVNGNLKINDGTEGAGKVLTSNSIGETSWQTPAVAATGWNLNGNTVGATKSIGTIDNFDLPIITNNVQRVIVKANGLVGINTATPTSNLTVGGSLGTNIRTIATSSAVIATDYTILVSNGAVALNVIFPVASTYTGRIIVVKKNSTSTSIGTITLQATSIQATTTNTFGASTTLGTVTCATYQSDGTSWHLIASY